MALGWRKEYVRYKDYFLNILNIYKQKEDLRMFLEILLSLATISFFATFALRPTVVTISALLKEIESKEEIVAKMDTKIQNLAAAQALMDSEIARLPTITQSVPDMVAPEDFVRQLEGLAARNGVNLLGVSLGQVTLLGQTKKAVDEEGLTPLPQGAFGLPFSLSVSGAYSELLNFLADLESLRRPLTIDTSGITASETDDGKVLVILVSGRAPYLSLQ
jgi:Tfp pilus assembly protein PilO